MLCAAEERTSHLSHSTPSSDIATQVRSTTLHHADAASRPASLTLKGVTQELELGGWETFLLWVCRTDPEALRSSTLETRLQLTGLSYMVLIVSLLAFTAGVLAMDTLLSNGKYRVLSFPVATLFTFLVFQVERHIVGTSPAFGKVADIAKFVAGLLVALAIGVPIQVKIFEIRVNAKLSEAVDWRVHDLRAQQRAILETAETRFAEASVATAERLRQLTSQQSQLVGALERAAASSFCGTRCEILSTNLRSLRSSISQSESAMAAMRATLLTPDDLSGLSELEAQIGVAIHTHPSVSARLASMWKVHNSSRLAVWWSTLIYSFLVALGLLPLFARFCSPQTEYHLYIAARERLTAALKRSAQGRVRTDAT